MRVTAERSETFFDGEGDCTHLHATIYADPMRRNRYRVECIADITGDRGEAWTYGETLPLTRKMADEIARRWCNGQKIPKRLEWR